MQDRSDHKKSLFIALAAETVCLIMNDADISSTKTTKKAQEVGEHMIEVARYFLYSHVDMTRIIIIALNISLEVCRCYL